MIITGISSWKRTPKGIGAEIPNRLHPDFDHVMRWNAHDPVGMTLLRFCYSLAREFPLYPQRSTNLKRGAQ